MDPELLARAREMVQRMRTDGVPDDKIDAYLKQQINAGLKEVTEPGLRDYARAAGQGASLGFGDELAGAVAAVVPGGKGYTEMRDAVRENAKAASAVAPKRMLAAELGGGLASSLAGGAVLGSAAKGASLAGRILGGAATGAAAGGAAGVGYSDKDPIKAGITGAVTGGVLGGTLPIVGSVVRKTAGAVANRLNPSGAIAKATGHLLPDDAEDVLKAREALAPGTTVPAALNPKLMAQSVRHISADPALARAAEKASAERTGVIQGARQIIGDQMEEMLASREAPVTPDLKKILLRNGLAPKGDEKAQMVARSLREMGLPEEKVAATLEKMGLSEAETIGLKTVQRLRSAMTDKLENTKIHGFPKNEMRQARNTLTEWLRNEAPDIGKLDRQYRTMSDAKRAEEFITKHIQQSRRSYASSRAAGIEPGSPGASLPSPGTLFSKLTQPDRKALAEAANRLLLQPGQIPPELLAQRAARVSAVPSLAGAAVGGHALGGLAGSLFDVDR